MKAEPVYGYCARDLHEEPERYSFSKTGDAAYVRSFLDLRKNKISEILKTLGSPTPLSRLGSEYPMLINLFRSEQKLEHLLGFIPQDEIFLPVEFSSGCEEFSTRKMVSLIILKLLEGKPEEQKERLDALIRKFEVFRKIQSTYDNHFKKIGEDAENMGLYAYFSLSLLLSYSKRNSLKSLNTALKVNDMLTSRELFSEQPETLVLCCAALEWETELTRSLCNDQGINP